jgi:hypothetical protein
MRMLSLSWLRRVMFLQMMMPLWMWLLLLLATMMSQGQLTQCQRRCYHGEGQRFRCQRGQQCEGDLLVCQWICRQRGQQCPGLWAAAGAGILLEGVFNVGIQISCPVVARAGVPAEVL